MRYPSCDAYFWLLLAENGSGYQLWSGASKLDQKVGSLGGPLGSIAISKSCFQKISGLNPPPSWNLKWAINRLDLVFQWIFILYKLMVHSWFVTISNKITAQCTDGYYYYVFYFLSIIVFMKLAEYLIIPFVSPASFISLFIHHIILIKR